MNLLDYLTEQITDDQLIQAVSDYLDLSMPAQDIRADKRLLCDIFINPLLEDCYARHGAHTKHRKDCAINLVCSSLQRHTERLLLRVNTQAIHNTHTDKLQCNIRPCFMRERII